jgi:SNF2 family DNA or RNA helicase
VAHGRSKQQKEETKVNYVSRHQPWGHQKTALTRMGSRESFALLMAMRTGKTKTLLDNWGQLEAEGLCPDLLVIAPAGVYRTWEKAIKEHLSPELLARTSVFTWSAGMGKADEERQQSFLADQTNPRILLVNVEALSVVPRARTLCAMFTQQRAAMVAIDESTAIKNYKAKRTKYINQLLKPLAGYRRILTGLVTPKSPLDLYSQFEFLDPHILGHKSYASFRMRYAVTQQMRIPGRRLPFEVVVGYRDVEELADRIADHSFRVRLEDCYDLPEKMYTIREVTLTDEQKKAYNEIKQYATTKLECEKHVTTQQVITQILRMHQVLCGHVGTEDGKLVHLPENRTAVLLDVLEEHEGKAIIWASYDADIRKLSLAIEKQELENLYEKEDPRRHIDPENLKHVARFWGGNRTSREAEEQKFLSDPNCRYMVATAAAGGRGRTWTVADLVVYYSNTADLEHRAQSEERAQGVDKVKSVLYVDLVAPGTVDEKMLQALRNKINMSSTITGDAWREWVV